MRHNPASGAIVIMLRQLKMHGMAQAVGELTEQGAPAFEAAIPVLSQLLKAETAEREVRSRAYQLKTARFPAYRDLTAARSTKSSCASFIAATSSARLTTSFWLADPAEVKRMSPRRSAFKPSSIIISGFGSSRPSNWSTLSSRGRPKDGPVKSPIASYTPTSLSWTSLATCHSAHQAAHCSSTC